MNFQYSELIYFLAQSETYANEANIVKRDSALYMFTILQLNDVLRLDSSVF